MKAAYCYLPILPARWGQFRAVGRLSPTARSRLTPLFDVHVPVLKKGQKLETYLVGRVDGMYRCWEADRPLYVDVYNFPLDMRTESGARPIAYLLNLMRSRGLRGYPGRRHGIGAGLRLPHCRAHVDREI